MSELNRKAISAVRQAAADRRAKLDKWAETNDPTKLTHKQISAETGISVHTIADWLNERKRAARVTFQPVKEPPKPGPKPGRMFWVEGNRLFSANRIPAEVGD